MSDQSGSYGQDPSPNRRQFREAARIVLAVVALVVLVAFVVDNSSTVKVGFVFFSAHISLIWALLIAAFLGMLVDRLIIFLGQRRRTRTPQR